MEGTIYCGSDGGFPEYAIFRDNPDNFIAFKKAVHYLFDFE